MLYHFYVYTGNQSLHTEQCSLRLLVVGACISYVCEPLLQLALSMRINVHVAKPVTATFSAAAILHLHKSMHSVGKQQECVEVYFAATLRAEAGKQRAAGMHTARTCGAPYPSHLVPTFRQASGPRGGSTLNASLSWSSAIISPRALCLTLS